MAANHGAKKYTKQTYTNNFFSINMTVVATIMQHFSLYTYYSKAKAVIYDTIILKMTEKWYRSVLEKLDDGSIILDVGIGTGGALLRCIDLIESKDLKIIGIDIDDAYVQAGKKSIEEAGLSDRISIDNVNVYDGKEKILELAIKYKLGGSDTTVNSDGQFLDAVYFSGSFSLLPDPVKALQLVSTFVKKEEGGGTNDTNEKKKGGGIYITQTYQRRTPFFMPYVKPILKYITTIDFGQLVSEEDIMQTFKESGLKVVKHEVIEGSIDNVFQAAWLSILR